MFIFLMYVAIMCAIKIGNNCVIKRTIEVCVHCRTCGSMEIPKLLHLSSVNVALLVSGVNKNRKSSLACRSSKSVVLSSSSELHHSPHCWPYLHNIETVHFITIGIRYVPHGACIYVHCPYT